MQDEILSLGSFTRWLQERCQRRCRATFAGFSGRYERRPREFRGLPIHPALDPRHTAAWLQTSARVQVAVAEGQVTIDQAKSVPRAGRRLGYPDAGSSERGKILVKVGL